MIRSLRSRHLLNGIVIIIMGILVLGALLSLSIHQRKTDTIGGELERTALDLLGFIEYEKGSFFISDSYRSEADAFLNERRLRTSGKERFAYLWDKEQQKIIWDSLDNDDVDQQNVAKHFALFDFEAILQKTDPREQEFRPSEARIVDSLPVAEGEKPVQYMVATQKFTMNAGGSKKEYLFLVATSLADLESEIEELVVTYIVLLVIAAGLLFVAQLMFSWWVMAPLKRFEKEALDIKNGNKNLIENDYPAELKSVQDIVNALVQRGNKQG